MDVYADRLAVLAEFPSVFKNRKLKSMYIRNLKNGLKVNSGNYKIAYFNMLYFISRRKVNPAFASFQVVQKGISKHYPSFLNLGKFLITKRSYFSDGLAMLQEAAKIRSRKAYYLYAATLEEAGQALKKARRRKEARAFFEMAKKARLSDKG